MKCNNCGSEGAEHDRKINKSWCWKCWPEFTSDEPIAVWRYESEDVVPRLRASPGGEVSGAGYVPEASESGGVRVCQKRSVG